MNLFILIYNIIKTMNRMTFFVTELNRFLYNNVDEFDDSVIDYGISFVKRINNNDILYDYFYKNNISIYTFLSDLLPFSQKKVNMIGDGNEILTEDEINQVLGSIIIKDEILRLILKHEITIIGMDASNQFIYDLSNDAILYFNMKYNITLNKTFSMSDILVISTDNNIL